MPKLGQKIRHLETGESWEFLGYAGEKYRVRNEQGVTHIAAKLFVVGGLGLTEEDRVRRDLQRKIAKKVKQQERYSAKVLGEIER